MSERHAVLLLEDILSAIQNISEYSNGMSESDFISDKKTCDAVIRNFEIIGEASNKMPDDVKKKFDAVKWREVTALRNILIHNYFGTDNTIVWKIIQEDLHLLETTMRKVLTDLQSK